MSVSRKRITQAMSAFVATCAAGALAVYILAALEGVSMSGWAMARIAPMLSPDLQTPEGVRSAVKADRTKGPGKPWDQWLELGTFSDEGAGQQRLFRLKSHRGGKLHLLYLHGGGYVLDLNAAQWAFPGGLLERLGGEAVVPLYPLAPEHSWREGLDAAHQAYMAMLTMHPGEPIVLVGDSAGGGLALVLAQSLRESGALQPAALVLFSPSLDVSKPGDSASFRSDVGRLWARDLAPRDPRVSPIYGQLSDLPPTIVFSGMRDRLDADAVRLKRMAPEIELRRYPGMAHVWPVAPIPEGKRALDEAAEFIRTKALLPAAN